MIIPLDSLAADTLQNIIEAFVLREGTDYGAQEVALVDKVSAVEWQLKRGEVVLVWSDKEQSVNIVPRQALNLEPKEAE